MNRGKKKDVNVPFFWFLFLLKIKSRTRAATTTTADNEEIPTILLRFALDLALVLSCSSIYVKKIIAEKKIIKTFQKKKKHVLAVFKA